MVVAVVRARVFASSLTTTWRKLGKGLVKVQTSETRNRKSETGGIHITIVMAVVITKHNRCRIAEIIRDTTTNMTTDYL